MGAFLIPKKEVLTLEQRVKEPEKRVANLEDRLQSQPDKLKEMLDSYFTEIRRNKPTLD